MAKIEIEIDLDDLASELQYLAHDDIVRFVVALDAYVADIQLTRDLTDALQAVIDEEEG